MMSERDYAENGTDPVVTLTAADPEERMVYWSLLQADRCNATAAGVDGDDFDRDVDEFMITPSADGASASLSFKFPPDYEMPKDGVMTDATNTYKVVVVAADDAPGAVVDADTTTPTFAKRPTTSSPSWSPTRTRTGAYPCRPCSPRWALR